MLVLPAHPDRMNTQVSVEVAMAWQTLVLVLT